MKTMACLSCDEPIDGEFNWVNTADGPRAMHWECALRLVIGGLNHQLKTCTCCGGTEPPDPPHLTRRQAAQAAAMHWEMRHAMRCATPSMRDLRD